MIRKLAPHVVQNIAAGELVERPASVLKELIENSIDADATQIKVEHEGGGIRLLRVSDNGKGISPEDLELVFESHATSKIQFVEDLSRIITMGFRGEAMSSIGSVARVSLWTGSPMAETGFRADVHFGQWKGKTPADRRVGTEVCVQDLFEKLPVRRKFLKSETAEGRQLYILFKRYALVYPDRQWSFFDGTRKKAQLGVSSLRDRSMWYFDFTDPEQVFEVEGGEEWKVHFVGLKPRFFTPSRRGLLLFLNKRPIKDRSLEFAVRRAFEGFTEKPQDLVGALFLEGPPEKFDVNVHPSKIEVRFQNSQEVFSAVVSVLRNGLAQLHRPTVAFDFKEVQVEQSTEAIKEFSASELRAFAPLHSTMSARERASENLSFFRSQEVKIEAEKLKPQQIAFSEAGFESTYEYLGSIERTFWIVKREEQLYLFDQHALHERVLYEQLMADFKDGKKIPSQRLLFPIEVSLENLDSLLEEEELLEKCGFEIRQWKSSSLKILAVPSVLKRDHAAALEAIAQCRHESAESFLRETIATLACHSALRAHDEVQPEQAKRILSHFSSRDALGHCPHGRPTFVSFDRRHLEKFFHRV